MRLIVLWCPDFPAAAATTAAGLAPTAPVAVVEDNRVAVCSATARADGVRRGHRTRQAQNLCPELVVIEADPDRDAAAFEPVAAAVEDLVPGIEILRPGLLAMGARGPARYFGGEEVVAERLVDAVEAQAGIECQVGAADTVYAATLAAHRGVLVPPGQTAQFLAPLDIRELDQPAEPRAGWAEFVDLLRRLGIHRLGDLAALPATDVTTRFGPRGVLAHRRASGIDEHAPDRRQPPADLAVAQEFDPPLERVDVAAFAAKTLGETLYNGLAARGLACTRLAITATTEKGRARERIWRCAEPLTVAGTVDRVRWQLDGWLRATGPAALGSGITTLRLEPVEVLAGEALQLDLLTNAAETSLAERAGRAMVRVQGVLGPDGILLPHLSGGRTPNDQVRLTPWGEATDTDATVDHPWPGRLLPPTPTTTPPDKPAAGVFDATGEPVRVVRSVLSAPPHTVQLAGFPRRAVASWGPPWPLFERWWTTTNAHRTVRLQVVLTALDDTGELALLLGGDGHRWWVEGTHD
ncbi:DNA polymerase Y family protein [Allokutzneria oryzae]|uniref:DNA polymerase Y family protein n=1 Tax=Allokutzneria oryzae TaxID=1378989 RepID=A0ABV6A3P4_9PSEU